MTEIPDHPFEGISRRDFLRLSASVWWPQVSIHHSHSGEAGKTPAASVIDMPYTPVTSPDGPRIGIIGTGGRGTSLLENLLGANAKVLAICDIVREKAAHAQGWWKSQGRKHPALHRRRP